ncbi:MAG: RNA-binding protein [Thermoguttaceae bacterium]|nr:RNA-binding protein [Thermoguttaceae bacterium]
MKIYAGNLSFETTAVELRSLFEKYGVVSSVEIAVDRKTNRSKGFGFVVMPVESEARNAIENLDGFNLGQRTLRINESRAD